MQKQDTHLLFSASDIVAFLGCKHRTALDLKKLDGWEVKKAKPDAATALVQEYGDRHERAYLKLLIDRGLNVFEVNKQATIAEQVEATREAMRQGADVIFQATLLQKPFLGYADFLIKVDGPSDFGGYHYEIVDTKLAKSNKAKFMVQLCFYADLLAAEQGVLPEHLHVVLGELDEEGRRKRGLGPNDENIDRVRTEEYIHHARQLRDEFLGFMTAPSTTEALPSSACGQCHWRDHCQEQWELNDHVCLVANIRRDQIDKLSKVGVTTMKGLGSLDGDVKGIGVLEKLKVQAKLQSDPRDANGNLKIQPIPAVTGPDGKLKPVGFSLLPEPDPGDLYFDMEGFPHEVGGLEYLFGVGHVQRAKGQDPALKFKPFWGHNRAEEKQAFEDFMDYVEEHLQRHPGAHIYHYASYEKTAIQRLSSLHDTRTEFRDRLLKEGRLVDLYRVVSSGVQLAVPSYSIKKVEAYYRGQRQGEVANAGESIVMYEAFRLSIDPEKRTGLLRDIELYNFDDVESTWQLHMWLESIRPANTPRFTPLNEEELAPSEAKLAHEAKEAKARLDLANWVEHQSPKKKESAKSVAELLCQLLSFYWRCSLPGRWREYERAARDEAELIDDMECLALLESTGEVTDDARSKRYHFRVPDQETKLATGATVACMTDGLPALGFIYDPDTGIASFKRGVANAAPPQLVTLCADDNFNDKNKLQAIFSFIDRLTLGQEEPGALLDLLRKEVPRLQGHAPGQSVLGGEPEPQKVLGAIRKLQASYLVIQGPPGTGKTTTASQVIAGLIADGKKVAISANSHAAINHLLKASVKRLKTAGTKFTAVVVKPDEDLPSDVKVIKSEALDVRAHDLAGGTAWLFCRPEQTKKWDYLFVDEASQVALADAIAAGSCAKNIVFLGDQMQLPQPSEGTHPGESGLSVLEYLMRSHATVPAERGIFLGTTHRMHPLVCKPISDGVYEGKLISSSACASQKLVLNEDAEPALKATGVVYVPVAHQHRSQSAPEEARRIRALFESLLKQHWINHEGEKRALTAKDILIVAPYRAQVRELQRVLGSSARVGTVDKIQGQEAAVSIVSMTTSDAENLPRSLDFLFSKNRLNVAVSRAKCLSLLVGSPGLHSIDCASLEEMGLLSFYARLVGNQVVAPSPVSA